MIHRPMGAFLSPGYSLSLYSAAIASSSSSLSFSALLALRLPLLYHSADRFIFFIFIPLRPSCSIRGAKAGTASRARTSSPSCAHLRLNVGRKTQIGRHPVTKVGKLSKVPVSFCFFRADNGFNCLFVKTERRTTERETRNGQKLLTLFRVVTTRSAPLGRTVDIFYWSRSSW